MSEITRDTPRLSRKQIEVGNIFDHIMGRHEPDKSPVVLMWTELMNEVNATRPGTPPFRKDSDLSHAHLKVYLPGVMRALKAKGLTPVKVGASIRQLACHGQPPDRGNEENDKAYRDSLAGSDNRTCGLVIFPRNQAADHPLILTSSQRRVKVSLTVALNTRKEIDQRNGLGVLTDEPYGAMRNELSKGLLPVIIDNMPLFNQTPQRSALTDEQKQ